MLALLYAPLLFAVTFSVPAPTACSLVTAADVRQALGHPVSKGAPSREGSQSTCDYDGGSGQVTVTIQRLAAPLDLRAEVASLKAGIPEGTLREAPGIPARAFFLDIPGAGTQLYVIRGDTDFILVSILGFGEPAQVSATAEALARKALARL